jgi:hypothetical protein
LAAVLLTLVSLSSGHGIHHHHTTNTTGHNTTAIHVCGHDRLQGKIKVKKTHQNYGAKRDTTSYAPIRIVFNSQYLTSDPDKQCRTNGTVS